MKYKTKVNKKLPTAKAGPIMGDKHWVDGVLCEVKFINAGTAFLCPTFDDDESKLIARHICFAKLSRSGKVTVL